MLFWKVLENMTCGIEKVVNDTTRIGKDGNSASHWTRSRQRKE